AWRNDPGLVPNLDSGPSNRRADGRYGRQVDDTTRSVGEELYSAHRHRGYRAKIHLAAAQGLHDALPKLSAEEVADVSAERCEVRQVEHAAGTTGLEGLCGFSASRGVLCQSWQAQHCSVARVKACAVGGCERSEGRGFVVDADGPIR